MSIPMPASESASPRSVAPHCNTTVRKKVNNAVGGIGGRQLASFVDDVPDPVLDDGPVQILFRWEMPVHGSGADSGPAGDLVDRHGQSVGREGLVGDLQHAGTVARRIGTQRAVGLSHVTPRE